MLDVAHTIAISEENMNLKKLPHLLLLVIALSFAIDAYAQDTASAFQSAVADYQKNPTAEAAGKVIQLAKQLPSLPAVPEDAERYMARGTAAIKDAHNTQDYIDAANEFQKAIIAAPWLANPYYNLAVAQSKSGDYDKAVQNLKLYLLATPDGPDAKAAKSLMYELEFKAEKAVKEKTEQQRQAQEAAANQRKLHTIEGVWVKATPDLARANPHVKFPYQIISKDVNGRYSTELRNDSGQVVEFHGSDHELTQTLSAQAPSGRRDEVVSHLILSDDGSTLAGTHELKLGGYKPVTQDETWSRK